MRTLFDISPLHRTASGIDRVFDLLEASAQAQGDNYPPFDAIRLDDDQFRLTLAVPGFADDEIAVTSHQDTLIVSGERKSEPKGEFLHRGIPARVFSRRFQLAEHTKVTGASLANGLLSIELRREVPEALKPRVIPISADTATRPSTVRQLQNDAA